MNYKKVISIVLGAFVLISVGIVIYNESGKVKASPNVNLTTNLNAEKEDHNKQESSLEKKVSSKAWIDATYFYTTQRCYTCKRMEKFIRESLDEGFGEKIRQGKINFQIINVDLPENKHYVQDYKLYTKSFVLSLKKSGKEEKWLNCDKIWKLAGDEQGFKKYIKSEVQKYLEIL